MDVDTKSLRELYEAVTPGPWHTESGGVVARGDGRQIAAVAPCGGMESLIERDARADLIAKTHNALPALLNAAEELGLVRRVRAEYLRARDEREAQRRAACDAADHRAASAKRERDVAYAELDALAASARQSACVVIPVRPGGPYAAVRSRKHRGAIELPGGKVEPGETPRAAARREVREELGVEMMSERTASLGTFLHVFEGRVWCAHAFLGEVAGAHLGEGDAGETTWATREELIAGTYGAVVARIFAALDACDAATIRARGEGGR